MTHDVIVILAALGVAGQVLAVLLLLVGAGLALRRCAGRATGCGASLEGYELWCVFLVASIATGGSLFFSEVAGFIPCELCWYQRICMYPLSIISLLAALANDRRVARYLLPLPLVGAGVSVYHLLVENGVVEQAEGVPALGARRLRDEVDQRVRLHDDPDARADRLRALLRLPAVGRLATAVCGYRFRSDDERQASTAPAAAGRCAPTGSQHGRAARPRRPC